MRPAEMARRHVACLAHAREIGAMTRGAVLSSLGLASVASDAVTPRVPAQRGARSTFRTPVLLVPGYGGNRSNWGPLERRLAAAGYANVQPVLYDPATMDVRQIAERLVFECHRAMRSAGTSRVHIVGHSMGGVALRYAAHQSVLAEHLGVAVTVASPHRGTAVARLGRGPAAADLRPDSDLLAALNTDILFGRVRWVAYWSDADIVVHPRSARLDDATGNVRNVLVPGTGHISILRSPLLLDSTVQELARADSRSDLDMVVAA